MNKRGNPKSLVASQPGNLNAVKEGVHSPRLIQARAAEIASELTESFEFSPAERLAVHETARCIAILEAIDRDLDQRGLVDRTGQPRYLLNYRSRTSRQLAEWLDKVSAAIERQTPTEEASARGDFPDYVRAPCRGSPSDTIRRRPRATAWPHSKELLELGPGGTTSYLERPAQPELREREHAIRETRHRQSLDKRERDLGIAN
jgi:hypothetical protein